MNALILAAAFLAAPDKPEPTVKELQKERIATLKKAAKQSVALYEAGRIAASEVFEDQMELLAAELEVAEKDSDRIEIYKKAREFMKSLEDFANLRFMAGRGTEKELLKAKAKRLEIEIALKKLTSKQK